MGMIGEDLPFGSCLFMLYTGFPVRGARGALPKEKTSIFSGFWNIYNFFFFDTLGMCREVLGSYLGVICT